MEKPIYIHYGHKFFNPHAFKPIQNEPTFTKPKGGLWASRVDADYGWKEWCENENFGDCTEDNAFKFTLKDSANVLHVKSHEDVAKLKTLKPVLPTVLLLPDFESMKESGIDAIELHLSDDYQLYWDLYGWDCDSILIMNPDVLEVI